MINYIIFSERKKLADEYEEWVNKPLEDGSKIIYVKKLVETLSE